jgi:hypothetical protein
MVNMTSLDSFLFNVCIFDLIGLVLQVYLVLTGVLESVFVALYAGMVVMWACVLTEVWKRTQFDLAFRWGMEGFEEDEGTYLSVKLLYCKVVN